MDYENIINLPHPTSKKRMRMDSLNRAAQFAPFAALTGHSAALVETARVVDKKIELNEDEIAEINLKLNILKENIQKSPEVTLTYFIPDKFKNGGSYIKEKTKIYKINQSLKEIIIKNKHKISFENIFNIESKLFS